MAALKWSQKITDLSIGLLCRWDSISLCIQSWMHKRAKISSDAYQNYKGWN